MESFASDLDPGVREQTKNLVQAYASARIALDYAAMAALLHPEARFVMPANSLTSAFAGECRGRDNICEMLRQADAMLEFYDVRILDLLIDGNKAVTRWTSTQRNRGGGPSQRIRGCAFFTQENGLIIENIRYCDTAAVHALVTQD